jgi:hypothetical protein
MRIVLILLLVAAAVPATAADSPEAWLIPFAAAYQPPVGGFNPAFAGHGMPEARNRHFGWGIELRSLTGSFLVGPLFFKTWDDAENSSYQLRTDATGIFGEAGVKLAPVSFLTIVPMLGVGSLSQSFSIREKTGEMTLDSLLGYPGRSVSLATGMKLAGMAALELGLIANSKAGGIGVALRGGYLNAPFSPTWHIVNGATVGNAPNDRLGGWFFSVGLLLMPQTQTVSQTN